MSTGEKNAARPKIDHVERLIREQFAVSGGALCIDGHNVQTLAKHYGTPLFIYSSSAIETKVSNLKSSLPRGFELYYSIKANPNSSILKLLLKSNCGLEIASTGELHQALSSGCAPNRILYAGPCKTDSDLGAAVSAHIGEIHLESVAEANRLNDVARAAEKEICVALRINPSDASGGAMRMGGQASPFGIPEEDLESAIHAIQKLSHLRITGVHLFMGTQILDVSTLRIQYGKAVELATKVAEAIKTELLNIDFGGGLGSPYFAHEQPLDITEYQQVLNECRDAMDQHPLLRQATGIIEPGRFLVSEAGIYVTQIQEVKHSRGKDFVICDGGMHHHLAASGNLGQTIKRNYPLAILNKLTSEDYKPYQVVGPLCTPLDTFGRNSKLPEVNPGDLLGVFQSGAYARTASPHGFLSHPSPPEILTFKNQVEHIRRRGVPADLYADQCCVSTSTAELRAAWSK